MLSINLSVEPELLYSVVANAKNQGLTVDDYIRHASWWTG